MIPSYKEMMFPILRFIGKRGSIDSKEVCKFVVEYYKFNDDELSQRIPSGMLLYVNRTGWALSYFAGNKEVVNLPGAKNPVKKNRQRRVRDNGSWQTNTKKQGCAG